MISNQGPRVHASYHSVMANLRRCPLDLFIPKYNLLLEKQQFEKAVERNERWCAARMSLGCCSESTHFHGACYVTLLFTKT